MDTKEFVLKGVKDGSITIEQALALLKDVDAKQPELHLLDKVKNETFETLANKYIEECLYGGVDENGEEFDGLSWNAIEKFLIDTNWECVDHRDSSSWKTTNLFDTPDIAKYNAYENAKSALEGVVQKYIDYKAGLIDEDEVHSSSQCGVFTAEAWLEEGGIHLEVEFTPNTGFTYIDNPDKISDLWKQS